MGSGPQAAQSHPDLRTTPGAVVAAAPGSHLHWPLSASQVGSVSSWTPGREQLHSSQPTRGWQPKVWGWQTMHSGRSVRGGQMHWPVNSSHRRPLQSQAVGSTCRAAGPLCPAWRPQATALGGRGHGQPNPGPVLPSSGTQASDSNSDMGSANQNSHLVSGTF